MVAYPFFYFLRRAFPKSRIVSACVPWVQDVQFRDLVDEVFVLPRPRNNTLYDRARALEAGAHELRKLGSWDLGISLPNSFSSAWILLRAQAQERRGYKTDGRGFLLNHGQVWDEVIVRHRAQAYCDLLPVEIRPGTPAKEFWGVPPENELDSGIPGIQEKFRPEISWPGFQSEQPPRDPYWVLAPGTTADSRRWPLENFRILARQIAEELGLRGAVVGGVAEALIAESLCEDDSLRMSDFTARGSIPVLSKLLSQAQFTVCNDSGVAHVAALCGSPVYIVWGAGDPCRTKPLGPGRVSIIANPIECWPCERNICLRPAGEKLECLRGVYSEAVWKEIQSGVRGISQSGT